jgi:hypothetical protein
MKKIQQIIYRCDFCNKPMFGAGAMSRHEKWCKNNPQNAHKCFEFCKHLEKTTVYEDEDCAEFIRHAITQMTCKKRNVKMYSFKFEKNTSKPKNALDGLERMPLECELFEEMHFDEYKGGFIQ